MISPPGANPDRMKRSCNGTVRSLSNFYEEVAIMWRCTVCGYVYDEAKEGKKFEELPDDWTCPVCNAPKEAFVKM